MRENQRRIKNKYQPKLRIGTIKWYYNKRRDSEEGYITVIPTEEEKKAFEEDWDYEFDAYFRGSDIKDESDLSPKTPISENERIQVVFELVTRKNKKGEEKWYARHVQTLAKESTSGILERMDETYKNSEEVRKRLIERIPEYYLKDDLAAYLALLPKPSNDTKNIFLENKIISLYEKGFFPETYVEAYTRYVEKGGSHWFSKFNPFISLEKDGEESLAKLWKVLRKNSVYGYNLRKNTSFRAYEHPKFAPLSLEIMEKVGNISVMNKDEIKKYYPPEKVREEEKFDWLWENVSSDRERAYLLTCVSNDMILRKMPTCLDCLSDLSEERRDVIIREAVDAAEDVEQLKEIFAKVSTTAVKWRICSLVDENIFLENMDWSIQIIDLLPKNRRELVLNKKLGEVHDAESFAAVRYSLKDIRDFRNEWSRLCDSFSEEFLSDHIDDIGMQYLADFSTERRIWIRKTKASRIQNRGQLEELFHSGLNESVQNGLLTFISDEVLLDNICICYTKLNTDQKCEMLYRIDWKNEAENYVQRYKDFLGMIEADVDKAESMVIVKRLHSQNQTFSFAWWKTFSTSVKVRNLIYFSNFIDEKIIEATRDGLEKIYRAVNNNASGDEDYLLLDAMLRFLCILYQPDKAKQDTLFGKAFKKLREYIRSCFEKDRGVTHGLSVLLERCPEGEEETSYYCDARQWGDGKKVGQTEKVFCPIGENRPSNGRKPCLCMHSIGNFKEKYREHMENQHLNSFLKNLHYAPFDMKVKKEDLGLTGQGGCAEASYRLSTYVNQLIIRGFHLYCSTCGKALLPDLSYSKSATAGATVSKFYCPDPGEEHDHDVYINRCYCCSTTVIDSRECKIRYPRGGQYLCMLCGGNQATSDEEKAWRNMNPDARQRVSMKRCPKCGSTNTESSASNDAVECRECGYSGRKFWKESNEKWQKIRMKKI